MAKSTSQTPVSRRWTLAGRVQQIHPRTTTHLHIWQLLLLCATIGMVWSDLYHVHVCGWLFMNSVFMCLHKRKATNNKIAKSREFTRKVCFFLSNNSYWEKGKRAQFNVLFQNITWLFFSCQIKNISSISKWIVHILISSLKRMILGSR